MITINTCTLYGAANYANNWISVNLLIVLISMAIIAIVYSLSRFMPDRIRGRVNEATRAEITQSIISVLIIAILIASAQMVCNTSLSFGKTILMSSGVSASQASLSPFQYADYYIGNLALHQGLSMLTDVYSTTMKFDVMATLYGSTNMFMNNWIPQQFLQKLVGDTVRVTPSISPDLSMMIKIGRAHV